MKGHRKRYKVPGDLHVFNVLRLAPCRIMDRPPEPGMSATASLATILDSMPQISLAATATPRPGSWQRRIASRG